MACSALEEWQELGEELVGVLEVRDVPAAGHDHVLGVGDIACGCRRQLDEVTQPLGFCRLRVLAERDDVILRPDNQQRRWRDQVVFGANGLLVDHLEGERRGASPLRVLGTEGDANQHVSEWLPHLRIGVDEVPLDVSTNYFRVGPVDLVVIKRLLGLRRDADPVIDQPEWIFEDQVRHPLGVHQREARCGHAPCRVTGRGRRRGIQLRSAPR